MAATKTGFKKNGFFVRSLKTTYRRGDTTFAGLCFTY